MHGRMIFLLEEPSMKSLIEGMLPRFFPGLCVGQNFLCIEHQGKSDLDVSIPRKLKNWKFPGDRFVIVRDNDNANCVDIKKKFISVCEESGRPDTLVRLVCQELESWYVGDLIALAEAFENPKLNSPNLQKRFNNPDSWQKPSAELQRLIPSFQKGSAARSMAQTLSVERNRSNSFQAFVRGVSSLIKELGMPGCRLTRRSTQTSSRR